MIYLDNSATTPPCESVIEVMRQTMRQEYFNASSAYAPAVQLKHKLEKARKYILTALGGEGGKLVFTSGATEANNLALRGSLPRPQGAHVVTSTVEHPSVDLTVESLAAQGALFDKAPVTAEGSIDLDALACILRPDTRLVTIMHVNNETGAVNDLAAISRLVRLRSPRAVLHVDGVQGFAYQPVYLNALSIHLYSFSAHKFHGPKGVGGLYVSKGVRLRPCRTGGGQEEGLRSGTYDAPAILGMAQAVNECRRDTARSIAKLWECKRRLAAGLTQDLVGVHVNGPEVEQGSPHILSLCFEGVRGSTLVNSLSAAGICASTGSACGSHSESVSRVLSAMGIPKALALGAVRLSMGAQNTPDEMALAARIICKEVQELRKFKRR